LVGGSGGERSESIDKGFRAAAHSLICNKATANGQRLHYFSPIMPTLTSRSPISCTPSSHVKLTFKKFNGGNRFHKFLFDVKFVKTAFCLVVKSLSRKSNVLFSILTEKEKEKNLKQWNAIKCHMPCTNLVPSTSVMIYPAPFRFDRDVAFKANPR
jgi:hypothetical protein